MEIVISQVICHFSLTYTLLIYFINNNVTDVDIIFTSTYYKLNILYPYIVKSKHSSFLEIYGCNFTKYLLLNQLFPFKVNKVVS